MINPSDLRNRLAYNPSSGAFFHRAKNGTLRPAGTVNSCGYIRIVLDQKSYLAHRLAWAYVRGEFPLNDIDHINGVRQDNRIENLRDVPRFINSNNRKAGNTNNSSGYLGVTAYRNKWVAQFRGRGGRGYLGLFDTAEAAALAYANAKQEYEGAVFCK